MEAMNVELLAGRVHPEHLPELLPRIIRVYLSAAGQDTLTERDIFIQEVYPKLREYCRRQYGLEFQVVDLGWGMEKHVENVDVFDDFRLRELQRCQTLSRGPNFIAIVGQKYGSNVLPSSIPSHEYDLIRTALHSLKTKDTRSAHLLDEWFIKDNNSVPAVHVLKQSQMLSDPCDADDVKRAWSKEGIEAQRLIQKGIDICYQEGLIDADRRDTYFMSAQEIELRCALNEQLHPKDKCVALSRRIVDIENYMDEITASEYIDILYDDKMECPRINEANTKLLHTVIRKCQSILQENFVSFEVLWRFGEVISPEYHIGYLSDICSQLSGDLSRLVDLSSSNVDQEPDIYKEVLHHWWAFRHQADQFFAMEDVLTQMETECSDGSFVVLCGERGSGKSTVMSKLAQQIQLKTHFESVVVVRRVGLTLPSSDSHQLISGICEQLLRSQGKPADEFPTSVSELFILLKEIISYHLNDTNVFFILDGVDQLSDFSEQFITALVECCQTNVRVVLSLDMTTKEQIGAGYPVVECKSRSFEEAICLFEFCLGQYGRKVTQEQAIAFGKALECCSLPIYIRLLVELAKNMKSSEFLTSELVPKSVESATHRFLELLERKHGKVIFSRVMGYLVESVTGLSDCEMEDILSLDDAVLDSLSSGTGTKIRRAPTAIWLSIKEDFETFMISKDVDRITVSCVTQSDILLALRNRYLKNDLFQQELHSVMADYFLGIWVETDKPVGYYRKKTIDITNAVPRYVLSQPLTFQDNAANVRYNCRKYDQVPRHLFLARRLEELDNLVLFNYEWLYNKTKALSLQHILYDLSLNPGTEVSLVEETLRMSEDIIRSDINNMVTELTGHLLPYYGTYPKIRDLIRQCDTDGLKHCPFIPNFPYQQVPGTSLLKLFVTPSPAESFLISDDGKKLFTKKRNSCYVHIHNISLGTHVNSVFASDGELYVTPDGSTFVIVDHETEKTVKVHDSGSGRFRGQLIVVNHIDMKSMQKYYVGPMRLTNDRICFIVTTDTSYLCVAGVKECEILQIVALDGRSTICTLTPDGNHLFCNSNEFLFSYDIMNLQHVGTVSTDRRATAIAVTKDGQRLYVCCDTKLQVYYLQEGSLELAYRTDLKEIINNDLIVDIKASPIDNMILLRGPNNILVYNRYKESICAVFQRPSCVPNEFKPPNSHPVKLQYTQADFSIDGNRVIGTIFRNIYIWEIATRVILSRIQAPLGVVNNLKILTNDYIMTNNENTSEVQIWNTDQTRNKIILPDRMSGPAVDALTTEDNRQTFMRFKESDEIGIVDMRTGATVDLLAHGLKVMDYAITPSGSHLLVSLNSRKRNRCAQIWDVKDRTTLLEFGDSPGHCLSLHKQDSLLFISQDTRSLHGQYTIQRFQCNGGLPKQDSKLIHVEQTFGRPFVTMDDRYIVLSATVGRGSIYYASRIFAFSVNGDDKDLSYSTDMFVRDINISSFVEVKPVPYNPCLVIVIISSEQRSRYSMNGSVVTGRDRMKSMFVLDLHSGVVYDNHGPPSVPNATNVTATLQFLHANFAELEEENKGDKSKHKHSPVQMSCLLLNGTAAIYFMETALFARRTISGGIFAKCDIHRVICHVSACPDDRTVVVGCEDGSVLSYVLIDPTADDSRRAIDTIPSRHVNQISIQNITDLREDLSAERFSRPPSAASGACEKQLLENVAPVDKIIPTSDTLLYLDSKSTTCSVM